MNHGVLGQIPRSCLGLLLVAQAVVIAPQVLRLPIWVVAVWVLCAVWRGLVHLGRWNYPGTGVKAGLILLGVLGVGAGYGQLYGLDPASALLVLAFSLKLLETRERRDALVVIYLAYFVIAVHFLYEQAMATAGYQLIATSLVTAALVGLNQSWSRPRWSDSLRTSSLLVLQAIPLTVILFIFFPRIAPLWSVPLPDPIARTGLSGSMSPGEIAELGRSSELAFRVEFQGEAPRQSGLYWRALTYSDYRDGTWSAGRRSDPGGPDRLIDWGGIDGSAEPWIEQLELGEQTLRYAVIVEPTYRRWLFALDFAQPLTPRIGIGRDFRLVATDPIISRSRYEIRTHVNTRMDPVLPDWLRRRELALPPDGNLRTRALALNLVRQGYAGAALAEQVLRYFRSEAFFYTLSPPVLTGDRIDQFLFETRRGFCAHYAGAFVFMMRQAGVPARVVAGYQGGELNPLAAHLIVRQYDAHAWAEIWLENHGWVRVDPTAAVSPERIDRGAEAALTAVSPAADLPFISARLRSFSWVMDALYYLDSLEYRWSVFVLSYDASRQNKVLLELLGEVTPLRIAIAMTAAATFAIGFAGMGTLFGARRRRRSPLLRAHDAFSDAFAAAGPSRAPAESTRRYAERLAAAHPELAGELREIARVLDAALFDPRAAGLDLALLRRRIRSLRRRFVVDRLRRTFERRGATIDR